MTTRWLLGMSRVLLLCLSVSLISVLCRQTAVAKGSPAPFKTARGLSRAIQTYTGINWLTGLTASTIATLVLKHEVDGGVRVRVRPYSFTDLLAGKLRGVDVRLVNASYNGAPIGDVRVSTQNPLWLRYFKRKGERPGVRIPLLIKVDGGISDDKLARALASEEVASKIRMIKINLPGIGSQQLQLLQPKVDFQDGQFRLNTLLVTKDAPPETGVNLTVCGKPLLAGNSRIVLENMRVESPDIPNPEEFSQFSSQLLNPLVDFARMDRLDHAFRMSDLSIAGDRLQYSGTLLLAPRPKAVQVGTSKAVPAN